MPRAYVVPKPGQELSEEEIVTFVDERVSAFKKLRGGAVITDAIAHAQRTLTLTLTLPLTRCRDHRRYPEDGEWQDPAPPRHRAGPRLISYEAVRSLSFLL